MEVEAVDEISSDEEEIQDPMLFDLILCCDSSALLPIFVLKTHSVFRKMYTTWYRNRR
jgi:hypothetical protein